jgi:hypothetical protein
MVTRKELLALLASFPPECEGCSAPLSSEVCEYCGRANSHYSLVGVSREALAALPDEPPDIRKTNASDDPCPLCQTVHSKDPYAPLTCRCLYCGQVGPVAMSTTDPRLGTGVVCRRCCGIDALAATPQAQMPWESTG